MVHSGSKGALSKIQATTENDKKKTAKTTKRTKKQRQKQVGKSKQAKSSTGKCVLNKCVWRANKKCFFDGMLKHISGAQKCIPGTRRKPHHVAQPQTQPSHIKAQPTNFKTCNCNPGGEKPKLNLTILVFLSKNIFGGGQGSQRGKQPRFILKKQTTFTPGGMKLPTFVCCCRGTDERG